MVWDIALTTTNSLPATIILISAWLAAGITAVAQWNARRHRIRPELIAPRMNALLSLGMSPRVAEALAHGEKIAAIKAYRAEHGVGLRESKEAIDRMESVIG